MEITITEYAARHNRSPVTVRQKALRGGFKTARRVGRDWLIDEDEPYTDNRLAAPPPPDLWLLTSGRRCDTISDAGAVKIANDSFSVLIPTENRNVLSGLSADHVLSGKLSVVSWFYPYK